MATVQRRDRQNIHESKDDRQEAADVPELVPVPRSREDTADRSETAQLLRSFFREQVFHIAHIAFQRFHTKRDACRERLQEGILLFHHWKKAVVTRQAVTPIR